MNITNRNHSSSSGFTLVELLVTIALFTIIVSIAVAGFINALRTQRQVSSLITAQNNVSLALEQITREMRTGYLFCHDPDSATPNAGCEPNSQPCIESDSGYLPTVPPAFGAADEYNSDLPTWTCQGLDYYAADGTHVEYYLNSTGQLIRDVLTPQTQSDGSIIEVHDPQSITGDNVDVHDLQFTLFGNIEGDTWTPRITISLGISPSSTDPATRNDIVNMQTTVSARQIDCTSAFGPLQC